jgi:hypothetical protein
MTISTFLMILALAVGPGTTPSMFNDSATSSADFSGNGEPDPNCWINGVWYNPCPADSPWTPEPPPDALPPG